MVIQVYSTAAQAIRLNLTWRANSLLLHIITYYKDYLFLSHILALVGQILGRLKWLTEPRIQIFKRVLP